MLNLPHRHDSDGAPPLWKYKGVHRAPNPDKLPFFDRPLPVFTVGVLSFLLSASAVSGINYLREAPYRNRASHSDTAPADPSQLGALDPDGSVYYLSRVAMGQGYCVHRPMVVDGPNNTQVMAGVGREGDQTVTVTLGPVPTGPSVHAMRVKGVVWSEQLGSFVTPENVAIGVVRPVQADGDCGKV